MAENLYLEMRDAFRAMVRSELDDMLPARVVSYDRERNRAVLQPMVLLVAKNGERIPRAQLDNVPVFRFGGGGFFVGVPLVEGDTGWVKASDRDISLFFQSLQDEQPNTARMHSFSDAIFIPDALAECAIDGKNAGALVIQSLDCATCIALDSGRVEIDADSVIVNAQQATINSPTSAINGDLTVSGDVAVGGDVTAAEVEAGGVTLTGHVHQYNWTASGGAGNTGKGVG